MKLLKRLKRIIIFSVPFIAIATMIGIIQVLSNIGIISINSMGTTESMDGGSSVITGDLSALLESAKKIDEYMADNDYKYDRMDGPWDTKYNDGNSKSTCCATYVSWCLQDVGMISEHTNKVDGIIQILENNSDWEKITVSDVSDMKPGDIGIYKKGRDSHTNIYAGNSKYWDAGTDNAVKSKGTISHRLPSSYVFRYKK